MTQNTAQVPNNVVLFPTPSAKPTKPVKPAKSSKTTASAVPSALKDVKGIGKKKISLLDKLHIQTLEDALAHYPRYYEDRTHVEQIADLCADEKKHTIRATVVHEPKDRVTKNGLQMTSVWVQDDSGTMEVVFFNNNWVDAFLKLGREYVFYGKLNQYYQTISMVQPQCEEVQAGEELKNAIVPVYPLTAGITQKDLLKVTDAALEQLMARHETDPLPEEIRIRHHLLNAQDALLAIHRPQSMENAHEGRRRLVFEELFYTCCGLQQLKNRRKDCASAVFSGDFLASFFDALPFSPTNAQRKVIAEVVQDCTSGTVMNRLVQGDVGSGKTIVATALCVMAAKSGFQAAVMAPTEILAQQHKKNLTPLLDKLGITTALLTSSMTAAQKRDILADIESGKAQVVIGTHALIQKDVVFHKLGAIVADEQHRFGVEQRGTLAAKGEAPHVLVMSATPIPRTLALILYGDLDVSVIDELPPGRTPVKTYLVDEKMRQRITNFIDRQIDNGGQVYVVCPLIEEGKLDCMDVDQCAQRLKTALPHRNIAVLHGKIKGEEKDQIMRDFAEKKYDILVATTVIEVGVDVPDATLMVVEDAQRFGFSQLHQLRGRVGRGSKESYCVLFGKDCPRLQVMCQTNDGFQVAQEDLKQRGPGDFFGTRQHGLPSLKAADTIADMDMLKIVSDEVDALLNDDPELTKHPELQAYLAKMVAARSDMLK